MPTLTERDKKFLIAGGLAVIVFLLIQFVVEPVVRMQDRAEQRIQNKIQFIERYYEILNRKSYYESKKAEIQKLNQTLNRRFLEETKPGLAAAGLQKLLEGFAARTSVPIERVRVEKPKRVNGLLGVPIEFTVRTSLRNLVQFIHQIESHEKFLVVEELATRRINKTDPEELQARLLVHGFIRDLKPQESRKT